MRSAVVCKRIDREAATLRIPFYPAHDSEDFLPASRSALLLASFFFDLSLSPTQPAAVHLIVRLVGRM